VFFIGMHCRVKPFQNFLKIVLKHVTECATSIKDGLVFSRSFIEMK